MNHGRIHFIGIGGTGMSSLAQAVLESGRSVSGSDAKHSQRVRELESMGARVFLSHRAENVNGAALVVYSSAISKENPERVESESLGIPCVHRSVLLAEFMREKRSISVAGTHGKTTTTALLGETLLRQGQKVSLILGGVLISGLERKSHLGSEWIIAEVDESDGSFLHVPSDIAVVTNVEWDHVDFYKTPLMFQKAFEEYVRQRLATGIAILNLDDPTLEKFKRRSSAFTFSCLSKRADLYVEELATCGISTAFTPVLFGRKLRRVQLPIPGLHNVSNALPTLAVGALMQLPMAEITQGLGAFRGVAHRFAVLHQSKNAYLVDDYAHNPPKIAAALSAARSVVGHKGIVLAIFEPHRYSRVFALQDEFARVFSKADQVIVLPVYAAGERSVHGLNAAGLATNIARASKVDAVALSFEEAQCIAIDQLRRVRNTTPVIVITLGAGDVKDLGYRIKEGLIDCSS